MSSRFLVFSKKKKVNLLISPEDLNFNMFNNFYLTFHKGLIFLPLSFPKIEILGLNCFYAKQHINFKSSCSIVLKQLRLFLKGLLQGFFLEFRIVGLGFKIKKGSKFYIKFAKFDIGFSHFFKLPIMPLVNFVRTKKRFMLFCHDYNTLKIILKNIQNLRKHNPYKIRGLKLTGFKSRTKPGKKQNKR